MISWNSKCSFWFDMEPGREITLIVDPNGLHSVIINQRLEKSDNFTKYELKSNVKTQRKWLLFIHTKIKSRSIQSFLVFVSQLMLKLEMVLKFSLYSEALMRQKLHIKPMTINTFHAGVFFALNSRRILVFMKKSKCH